MKTIQRTACIAAALLLSACAATVTRPTGQPAVRTTAPVPSVALEVSASPEIQASKDWQTFRAEWRTAFDAAATARGVKASFVDDPAAARAPAPAGAVLVKVHVNDYRYLTPAARFGFGALAGNAYVDATAKYLQSPGGMLIGERKFATSSSAWEGIFSAMTDKQLRAISEEILTDLTTK